MNWDAKRVVIAVAVLAAVVLLIWALSTSPDQPEPTDTVSNGQQPSTLPAGPGAGDGPPPSNDLPANTDQATLGAKATDKVVHRNGLPANEAEAIAAFEKGMAAMESDKIAARRDVSAAVLSGHLPADQAGYARSVLTELADEMLFSRRVFDNDPYVQRYKMQPGDVLSKVERKQQLHVPVELILKINRISDPRKIQAGQTLKTINGPFHAIVSKTTMTMDVFLHREGLDPIFVRRLPVGLGKDDGTPTGLWRIKRGEKGRHVAWYPPPSSGLKGRIDWGEPDYAFGEKGIWLPLEGLDENTEGLTDYGIHSTNDPSSIGRAESLGCIRLGDDDIEFVYATLYEHWSTVLVVR